MNNDLKNNQIEKLTQLTSQNAKLKNGPVKPHIENAELNGIPKKKRLVKTRPSISTGNAHQKVDKCKQQHDLLDQLEMIPVDGDLPPFTTTTQLPSNKTPTKNQTNVTTYEHHEPYIFSPHSNSFTHVNELCNQYTNTD
ncbi:hypothetical protein RhiirA5_485357 [Rhizophagus irregularis]|uniref:Uncharacterized protein n=1 Tax=Rhizophagus irregularis TaxID=588596 RepID=A0A2N0PF93_9GLOM|nr:hypothetical protein RhiirA5_485357 [Rhizophagus irregularis]PKC70064.1 hypothetical protein RhiirA1_502678 [Rhizophagus irregularis]CAB4490186.1 unnamed protein product [Rhizophagus irregularis]CAB5116349.1 unnamed protein product [Rhizophagus irregularis]CAB5359859.1 unnamed protein product [Rhizophagus irregularis]